MIVRSTLYFLVSTAFTVGIIYYALNPRIEVVKGGKLSLPEYASAKKKVTTIVRVLMVCLGLTCFFMMVVPLGEDIINFKPIVVEGRITDVSSGPVAAGAVSPTLKQTVTVNGENSYTMLFSGPIFRIGDLVELHVLPNSQMIVKAKIIKRGD